MTICGEYSDEICQLGRVADDNRRDPPRGLPDCLDGPKMLLKFTAAWLGCFMLGGEPACVFVAYPLAKGMAAGLHWMRKGIQFYLSDLLLLPA